MERHLLLAAGFKVKTYSDQEGEYLRKDIQIEHLPEALQQDLHTQMMDCDDQSVVVEVCPDQSIQFFVPAVEYHEAYPLDSKQGHELVRCAMQAN